MSEIIITSKPKKYTALYCRVSTSDQVGGLQSQERTLKEHCEKNKITDYQIFTDEGISGAKVNRPSLDRMLKEVREMSSRSSCAIAAITVLRKASDFEHTGPTPLASQFLVRRGHLVRGISSGSRPCSGLSVISMHGYKRGEISRNNGFVLTPGLSRQYPLSESYRFTITGHLNLLPTPK